MKLKRDDFHNVVEDDPETTIFTGLHSAFGPPLPPARSSMPWGRLASLALVAAAVMAVLDLFVL